MKDSQNIIRHPSFVVTREFDSLDDAIWYSDKIDYKRVNEITTGKGGKVAVIDSGIEEHQDELKGKIIDRYDATREGENLSGDHGTHVSGVIAGTNVGLFPDLQIGDFKALTSLEGFGSTDWLVYALEEAALRGYEVVSASIGSDYTDGFLVEGINKYTSDPKRILVCAAGNSGDTTDFPARYANINKGVMSVGAAGFNEGNIYIPIWSDRRVITVVAPGVDVLSSIKGNKYAKMSGTSMAAPFVSAMIAAAKAMRPEITRNEIHAALFETSHSVTKGSELDGVGFIDIANFLLKIKNIDIKEGLTLSSVTPKTGLTKKTLNFIKNFIQKYLDFLK